MHLCSKQQASALAYTCQPGTNPSLLPFCVDLYKPIHHGGVRYLGEINDEVDPDCVIPNELTTASAHNLLRPTYSKREGTYVHTAYYDLRATSVSVHMLAIHYNHFSEHGSLPIIS